jgi:hypothetical protein
VYNIVRVQEGHALSNVQSSRQDGLAVRDAATELRKLALFPEPALVYGLLHEAAWCMVRTLSCHCNALVPHTGCTGLCDLMKQP